jgi:hypothetical protein
MKPRWLLLAPVLASVMACNDLTEALPIIAGTYDYTTVGAITSLSRQGTMIIVDFDARTARFDGSFDYTTGAGVRMAGPMVGAFIERNQVWFRFLNEKLIVHEGGLTAGVGSGTLFFLGLTYQNTGATFTLRRRDPPQTS